jgi:hypothetical protein
MDKGVSYLGATNCPIPSQRGTVFRLKEFNLEAEDRNYAEDLSKLIIDFPEKNAKEKARDRLDTFKNKLADQGKKSKGVIGLAHELFSLL